MVVKYLLDALLLFVIALLCEEDDDDVDCLDEVDERNRLGRDNELLLFLAVQLDIRFVGISVYALLLLL